MGKKHTRKRKKQAAKQGFKASSIVAVLVVGAFLVLAFYAGTQYGLLQKDTEGNLEETIPSDLPETVMTTDVPTQPEEITLTLYFPSANADSVIPVQRKVKIEQGKTREEVIFTELQKGPEGVGTNAMIPEGTRFLSAETKDGICHLNLSSEFVDNNPGGTAFESLLIGSVVNSLTELPDVRKVQFLINGEKREIYSHATFDQPFERMESLIRTPDNTSQAIEQKIRELGENVLRALKERDMERLSEMIHPKKNLRLSPYSYIDVEKDQVFTSEQIKNALLDETVYTWGVYDGRGNPIELTMDEYLSRFVYDEDFIHAEEVGYNRIIGQGNTMNNVFEVYPDGQILEYHFPGIDPEYAGIDWRSLRLVFEEADGGWFLTGIIHDEWTI